MSWGLLDDHFFSNPKIVAAGLDGAGLYARALSYCSAHLTDGVVPYGWALETAQGKTRLLVRLVDVGLWQPCPGGYLIPDFTALNGTREEVLARRAAVSSQRSEAGRKGAAARWHRNGKTDGGTDGEAMTGTLANECQTDGPTPLEEKEQVLVRAPQGGETDQEHPAKSEDAGSSERGPGRDDSLSLDPHAVLASVTRSVTT